MLEIFDEECDLNKKRIPIITPAHLLEEEQRMMMVSPNTAPSVIKKFSPKEMVEQLIEEYQSYQDNCMPSYSRNEEEIFEGEVKRDVYDGILLDLKELLKSF